MREKFAVIGLGQFGYAVAKNLADRGAEVLAIDKDIERVEMIKDDVAYAVTLDSTDLKALKSQNISEMDGILLAIGENIEGMLLTAVLLLEMKPKRLIARAMSAQQKLILEKIGVEEILSPEDEVGHSVAEMMLNPDIKDFLYLPDNFEIIKMKTPRKVANKSIFDVSFQDNYDLQLFAISRLYEEINDGNRTQVRHLLRKPNPETVIQSSDLLVLLGRHEDIKKFIDINH